MQLNSAKREIDARRILRKPKGDLIVGLSGASRHACAALTDDDGIVGVCEQERITRVRAAGFNGGGLPDDALDLLLGRARLTRDDVARYAVAGDGVPGLPEVSPIDRHFAHACTAYLSSPFTSAVVVICDRQSPKVSVWRGRGGDVTSMRWSWTGIGFSDLYSSCAHLMGFGAAGDQRFEALARLAPNHRETWIDNLFDTDGEALQLEEEWEARLADWLSARALNSSVETRASYAAALQHRIAELLLAFLANVRDVTQSERLCLGGDLFYHSSLNTVARASGLFSEVFVPVDPGEAGLAVGAALHMSGRQPNLLSPFLGPAYTSDEIKSTVENCKIPYTFITESQVIEAAAEALQQGRLVGWYEGAMEWGQRALGARSIVANPFAPHVLENLNRFLKNREPWRGYALSALRPTLDRYFAGPSESPFMECDFLCLDNEKFRHVLPTPNARIRVHTADQHSPRGFRRLLDAFGVKTGVPCLVNTSFNSFLEPIVCSPRDAIRVFYSSGVDMMVLDRFLLSK